MCIMPLKGGRVTNKQFTKEWNKILSEDSGRSKKESTPEKRLETKKKLYMLI